MAKVDTEMIRRIKDYLDFHEQKDKHQSDVQFFKSLLAYVSELEESVVNIESAYEQGWREAADWTNADDLICDIDSPAYIKDRDRRLGNGR